MGIAERLIGRLAPHDCLGCGAEGSLLCSDCLSALPASPERCYRCHAASAGALTCSGCLQVTQLRGLHAATIYGSVAKQLVWKLKFAGAQEAVRIMARHMVPGAPNDKQAVIVPVPTATTRIRQRGYDQAKLVARELSKQMHVPYVPCLTRTSQAHQVGANRQQRLHQLQSAFRVVHPGLIHKAHILLVDDVITTGATLEAAANCLKTAGAQQIEAFVFCATLEN